jgi:hypothetical protein
VASVTSLVNSVQTNGSMSLPLHKRDVDVQARGTHRKSDSVRKLYLTVDTLIRHLFTGKSGKQITSGFSILEPTDIEYLPENKSVTFYVIILRLSATLLGYYDI